MANNTFTLQNIDKVNFYGNDSDADVYLEGVSTGTSGVCISGSLLVNGDYMNFGNTLGSNGYGFNNDTGNIKFKHSGGNWRTIPTDIGISELAGVSLGSANDIIIVDSSGNGVSSTSTLTIDPTNNYVGINQTNPEVTLHMTGTAHQTSQIRMEQYNDGTDAPDLRTRRYRGTPSDPANVQTEDYLFRMNVEGYQNGIQVYHSLQFDVDGSDVDAGVVQLQTTDTGGTLTTRFGIDSSGRVYHGNNAFRFPTSDGSANQVLQTDGNGYLSFATISGGSGGTPGGNDTDIQFKDGGSFEGVSALQFHKSTTSGVSALTVDGNVFSSMGVSDVRNETSSNPYQITATEFVNGFIFPPCQSADENQLFVVQVPPYSDIIATFSDVLKEGQTFDTVIYGTSIGSSPAIGMSFPSDITVLENAGVSFDRRLVSDKTISGGLSFHFADAGLDYYQCVVIRSRMGSAGVSMYPYATSFYTC